jgi:hypothetical protein
MVDSLRSLERRLDVVIALLAANLLVLLFHALDVSVFDLTFAALGGFSGALILLFVLLFVGARYG